MALADFYLSPWALQTGNCTSSRTGTSSLGSSVTIPPGGTPLNPCPGSYPALEVRASVAPGTSRWGVISASFQVPTYFIFNPGCWIFVPPEDMAAVGGSWNFNVGVTYCGTASATLTSTSNPLEVHLTLPELMFAFPASIPVTITVNVAITGGSFVTQPHPRFLIASAYVDGVAGPNVPDPLAVSIVSSRDGINWHKEATPWDIREQLVQGPFGVANSTGFPTNLPYRGGVALAANDSMILAGGASTPGAPYDGTASVLTSTGDGTWLAKQHTTIFDGPVPTVAVLTNQLWTPIVGFPYTSIQLVAQGGVPPYTWAMVGGTWPPGSPAFKVSSAGIITGTPTVAAGGHDWFVDVQATDSVGNTSPAMPLDLAVQSSGGAFSGPMTGGTGNVWNGLVYQVLWSSDAGVFVVLGRDMNRVDRVWTTTDGVTFTDLGLNSFDVVANLVYGVFSSPFGGAFQKSAAVGNNKLVVTAQNPDNANPPFPYPTFYTFDFGTASWSGPAATGQFPGYDYTHFVVFDGTNFVAFKGTVSGAGGAPGALAAHAYVSPDGQTWTPVPMAPWDGTEYFDVNSNPCAFDFVAAAYGNGIYVLAAVVDQPPNAVSVSGGPGPGTATLFYSTSVAGPWQAATDPLASSGFSGFVTAIAYSPDSNVWVATVLDNNALAGSHCGQISYPPAHTFVLYSTDNAQTWHASTGVPIAGARTDTMLADVTWSHSSGKFFAVKRTGFAQNLASALDRWRVGSIATSGGTLSPTSLFSPNYYYTGPGASGLSVNLSG